MKFKNFSSVFAAVTAAFISGTSLAAAPPPALKVGDPAPAINAMAWIQGEPVKNFKPGHVYIVEFWATWCGPCNEVMPHLSELQKKHAGKLTVIGVNARETERGAAEVEKVSAFVKKKGDAMAYTVAMDDPATKTVFKEWMIAGGSYGIPTSFVVDGKGRLVWVGHPLGPDEDNFNAAVEQALAGKSDLDKAREVQARTNEMNYPRIQQMLQKG